MEPHAPSSIQIVLLSFNHLPGSVCKVTTQDTDNFDEEVKPLAFARHLGLCVGKLAWHLFLSGLFIFTIGL